MAEGAAQRTLTAPAVRVDTHRLTERQRQVLRWMRHRDLTSPADVNAETTYADGAGVLRRLHRRKLVRRVTVGRQHYYRLRVVGERPVYLHDERGER